MKTSLLVLGLLTAGALPLNALAANASQASPAIAAATAPSMSPTIGDTLARQKMLGQRIVQSYARIGLEVSPDEARSQLSAAVDEFDRHLRQLDMVGRSAPNGEAVRQSLSVLAAQWDQVQAALAENPGALSAIRLAGAMDGALGTIDRLGVELAAGKSGTSMSELFARQAELSQRVARAYWLRGLGDDTVVARRELDAARRALEANLVMLRAHPDTVRQDKAVMARLFSEAIWLLAAIDNDGAQSYALVVADAAEQVLASATQLGAAEGTRL